MPSGRIDERAADARVVDEQVETPVGTGQGLRRRIDLLLGGDVQLEELGSDPVGGDLAPPRVACAEVHAVARLREPPHRLQPDTPVGTSAGRWATHGSSSSRSAA